MQITHETDPEAYTIVIPDQPSQADADEVGAEIIELLDGRITALRAVVQLFGQYNRKCKAHGLKPVEMTWPTDRAN